MQSESGPDAPAGPAAAAPADAKAASAPAPAGASSSGDISNGGAALAARINELTSQKGAAGAGDKSVSKEMKRLDKKLEDMPPDKAIKHLRAVVRDALVKERAAAAEAAAARGEMAKTMEARSRLEALCRGLQDSNRTIREESKRIEEAEQEKRAELSKQFQGTIADITARIEADEQAKIQQLEDHKKLALKLDQLAEQNDGRSTQFEKLLEAKDLECQLLQAKLNHATQLAAFEAKKAEGLALEMAKLKENEAVLKAEFQEYGKKFETLNKAMGDSSKAFETYRKEIESTRKELAKLTKEKASWQARYNKVNAALIVAQQDKAGLEESLRATTAKLAALENLCRALRQGQASGAPSEPPAAAPDGGAPASEAPAEASASTS